MRGFIPLQRQPGFRDSGILFLNMLFARYYWVKYGNLVERDQGLPAEGAARFRITRWTIVMRATLSQMQWRQSALGRVVPALLVSTLHLRSAPRVFAGRDMQLLGQGRYTLMTGKLSVA